MRQPRMLVACLTLVGLLSLPAGGEVASASTTAAPRVAGCAVFPSDNWWNRDVSALPVHRSNDAWLAAMSTDRRLHPDFGPSYGDGPDYGIPITVVRRTHKRVRVRFAYAAESDRVRYPLGRDTRVEGGRNSGGDMHTVIVNRDTCRLYETWSTRVRRGRWTAGSGATWSLRSNALRPDGWTSADAAGLPILPGLLRWDEVRSGRVGHAIRFTTDLTARAHLWPARHDAGSRSIATHPPMGARFRLRSDFPEDGYGAHARTVIRAMKHYGLVLADNGSPWFFQGEQNAAWPESLIEQLKQIPASSFEAVDTTSLMVSRGSAGTR